MNKLSKNIKNFIVVLKDKREINITEVQKNVISTYLAEKRNHIEIYDVDTKKLLFSGSYFKIDEIKEREITGKYSGIKCKCEYGFEHDIDEKCNHWKELGFFWPKMWLWLREQGDDIQDSSQITQELREKYIDSIKK